MERRWQSERAEQHDTGSATSLTDATLVIGDVARNHWRTAMRSASAGIAAPPHTAEPTVASPSEETTTSVMQPAASLPWNLRSLSQRPGGASSASSASLAEGRSATLGQSPVSVSLGPVGGILYIHVLEVGNIVAQEGSSSLGSRDSLGWCWGFASQPPEVQVSISCGSFGCTVNTVFASTTSSSRKVVFNEEFMARLLSFCSADKVKIKVQTKTAVLCEATLPLRVALPKVALTPSGSPCSNGNLDGAAHEDEASSWLRVQKVILHNRAGHAIDVGDPVPYVKLELLQLVDGSLSRLLGAAPLLRAIDLGQPLLLRAFLFFDAAALLPLQDQAACLTAAIQHGRNEFSGGYSVLLQLLVHIKPSHEHLLLAIRLGCPKAVEALLQVSGAMLLRHKVPISTSFADVSQAQRHSANPKLTPLALACSLGDALVVEALCSWSRREKTQVDPTAPMLSSGGSTSVSTPERVEASFPETSVWHHRGETPVYGDPPMVMVVRGRGSLSTKLHLLSFLAQSGFEADVRSPVDSWTPLLAAVDLGCLELLAALVKLGARISSEKHLGFTPLHLACQMGHWHLVPFLTEAMLDQHRRVAVWGPSPQYVSLNLADAYGRTALDIALLRYFANPLPEVSGESSGKMLGGGSDRQKAVDILREFVHNSPDVDAGMVCGWEMLGVLRLLDAFPMKKALGVQLMMGVDCAPDLPGFEKPLKLHKASLEHGHCPSKPSCDIRYGDLEDLLQAIRVLVRAGAQTKWLVQEVMHAPQSGGRTSDSSDAFKEVAASLRPRAGTRGPNYCPIDAEDAADLGWDDTKV